MTSQGWDLTSVLMPACPLGYTAEQVEQIAAEDIADFRKWIEGQTVAICDGRVFNHETREYEPSKCAETPHGVVFYPWDVARWHHSPIRSIRSRAGG